MRDGDKTKAELLSELAGLRQRAGQSSPPSRPATRERPLDTAASSTQTVLGLCDEIGVGGLGHQEENTLRIAGERLRHV